MKNKTLAVLSASLLCACASSGTYTWTGAAGDNLYFTAGNWSYDDGAGNVTSPAATAPARNTTDDIVIATGDAVNYVPGGDLRSRRRAATAGRASRGRSCSTAAPTTRARRASSAWARP